MGAMATLRSAAKVCPGHAPDRVQERVLRGPTEPAAPPAIDAVRSAATAAAVRDWLETQARVVEYWRDLLADAGATDELIDALDVHAAFLNGVAARG